MSNQHLKNDPFPRAAQKDTLGRALAIPTPHTLKNLNVWCHGMAPVLAGAAFPNRCSAPDITPKWCHLVSRNGPSSGRRCISNPVLSARHHPQMVSPGVTEWPQFWPELHSTVFLVSNNSIEQHVTQTGFSRMSLVLGTSQFAGWHGTCPLTGRCAPNPKPHV